MNKEDLQQLSDDDLIKIVTEDFRSLSPNEITSIIQELKRRDYEIDKDVMEDINQYLQVAEFTDEKLIEIVNNNWSYPKSLVEEVEKVLDKRKTKPVEKDFANNTREKKKKPKGVSQHTEDEGFAFLLDLVGYATIIIGVIIAMVLLSQLSKPGMFSSGEISGKELLTAFGVGFYHLVFGMLCFGVSKILRR